MILQPFAYFVQRLKLPVLAQSTPSTAHVHSSLVYIFVVPGESTRLTHKTSSDKVFILHPKIQFQSRFLFNQTTLSKFGKLISCKTLFHYQKINRFRHKQV